MCVSVLVCVCVCFLIDSLCSFYFPFAAFSPLSLCASSFAALFFTVALCPSRCGCVSPRLCHFPYPVFLSLSLFFPDFTAHSRTEKGEKKEDGEENKGSSALTSILFSFYFAAHIHTRISREEVHCSFFPLVPLLSPSCFIRCFHFRLLLSLFACLRARVYFCVFAFCVFLFFLLLRYPTPFVCCLFLCLFGARLSRCTVCAGDLPWDCSLQSLLGLLISPFFLFLLVVVFLSFLVAFVVAFYRFSFSVLSLGVFLSCLLLPLPLSSSPLPLPLWKCGKNKQETIKEEESLYFFPLPLAWPVWISDSLSYCLCDSHIYFFFLHHCSFFFSALACVYVSSWWCWFTSLSSTLSPSLSLSRIPFVFLLFKLSLSLTCTSVVCSSCVRDCVCVCVCVFFFYFGGHLRRPIALTGASTVGHG